MLKRIKKDKDGNILEDIIIPMSEVKYDKNKNNKEEKRKDRQAPKKSKVSIKE